MLKFSTRFLLSNVCKTVVGIFLFCLKLEVFIKIKRTWNLEVYENHIFYASNSRSKLNPKNLEYCSVDIGKWEACAKFQQKIFNSTEVGAHQSFQFFRHFSPKQCLNFVWEFALLNYYYQIIKISVLKTQLYINQASHLNVNIYLFIRRATLM